MIRRLFRLVCGLLGMLLLGFVTAQYAPLTLPATQTRPETLLIINARLVDVESGEIRPGINILLRGDRIVDLGEGLASADATVVNADGRYAIPGLFDMHVHSLKLSPALSHPLFIAAGVTAVRDMGGCIGIEDPWVACVEDKREWDRAVRAGEMVGPRYDQVTSLAVNGGDEIPTSLDPALGAATVEGAARRVEMDKQRGIDFLKPYTMLPREGYFAMAQAARENDMYLAGHLPMAVSALEAIDAGQRSVEHAFLFIWGCYPQMAQLRQLDNPRALYTHEQRQRTILEHDSQQCSALHQAMVAAGATSVPTHTTRKLDAFASDERFLNDPRLRYIPAPLQLLWRQDASGMAQRAGAGGQASYREFYQFGIQQTGIAHRAGVKVLVGTDAPDSYVFPGFSVPDELDHFVAAGISPLDALRAATVQPAEFLGLSGRAGVLKVGARADLVLLNENPLEDIAAVRSIDRVVLAGIPYSRSDLDAMLKGVEEQAGSWTMWPRFVWQALTSPIMRRQFED